MAEENRCPQCGDKLGANAPRGVCPKCLMKMGLESDAKATIDDPGDIESPGTRIGRYKLLQLIGEGGFGVVYMAEQEKPIRRRVALKIIKLGMDTKQVIARFEAERQALAMMDHANIARVFDAGATDTGRPYFVMELVKGIPITEYCDKNNLDTGQRLDLFIDVCKAVQHAHQKGIIHRDIKPSNVMITLHDGKPVPKIIDFGIAKATQHRLTEKTFFTEYRQFIGTPEYMSPEQAEMTGLDVDTRSDIYSLGVLLYELLTGTTPFEGENLRSAAYDEIRRIIREEEPPKPSTRLSSLGDALTDVAKHRHVQPAQLCKIVRGDLDWVVMKSLEKDRTRRYETANEFAADIGRHLGDEPVSAGPPSTVYRLRKFVQKHRRTVAAAVTVVAVLIVGLVVSTAMYFVAAEALDKEAVARKAAEQAQQKEANARVQAERAREKETAARTEAVAARDEAERQAKISQAVTDFLTNDVLPEATGGILSTSRVLDAASEKIEGKFEDAPLIEAAIRETLAKLYPKRAFPWPSASDYKVAEPHLERVLEIRLEQLGEEHPDTLRSMHNLTSLYIKQGRYDKAEPLYVKGLEVRRRVLGEEHPDTLKTMSRLAQLYFGQKRYDEAEPLFAKALEVGHRMRGKEDMLTEGLMVNLATIYIQQGRYDEAEPLLVNAPEIIRRVKGKGHPDTLTLMNCLAMLHAAKGRYDEAELVLVKALEIKRRGQGEDDPNTLSVMVCLAKLYLEQKRYAESEALLVKTLEIGRRVWSEEDPNTVRWTGNLATLYLLQKRYAEAEPLLVKTLKVSQRVLGEEHRDTLTLMHNLAALYRKRGRYAEAESLLVKLLEVRRRVLGEEHKDTLFCMIELARLQATCPVAEFRNGAKAVENATKACELTNKHYYYWRKVEYVAVLAAAYAEAGDFKAAVKWQKEAIDLLTEEDEEPRAKFEELLKLYQAGKPYRESPQATPD